MRIIDKNHDFYDYLQDPTDTLVFDRRESFTLTKENISSAFRWNTDRSKYRFTLLQCGVTFWLFLVKNVNINYQLDVKDVELLYTWKNYNKPRTLISFDAIDIRGIYSYKDYKIRDYDYNKLKENVKVLVEKIDRNEYDVYKYLSRDTEYVYDKKSKKGYTTKTLTVPILKASGFASKLNPEDVFYAIEEYFSLEKTAAERTEAIGTTNIDKITTHGFDVKTSFRGK